MMTERPRLLNRLISKTPSALDGMWLLLLAVYIMAGVALVPFHGDEAMQISMSRDYFTAVVNRQPQSLLVSPPYNIDSPQWLRLINGSVNVHTLGLSLHLNGYSEDDLPPLWQWPLSYDENVARGNRPSTPMLVVARIPSTVFLVASVLILFGIGWQFKGRITAYAASGLYAFSPVVLVNGRRAMMEGSVLCFGLLTIYLAILICKGRANWRWWLLLGAASGLTLASKHSGVVYVVSAFGWVAFNAIKPASLRESSYSRQEYLTAVPTGVFAQAQKTQRPIQELVYLVMSAFLAATVFAAASPALWNNIPQRLNDLLRERASLLESQVKAEPSAPTPLRERIAGILTQPYLQPPVYFEASFWANAAPVQAEIAAYDASPLSGLRAGTMLGSILTLCAAGGMVLVTRKWRTWQIGLVGWAALTAASLIINPLPWQRYYLSLYPLAALLTGIGLSNVVMWLAHQYTLKSSKVG